MYAVLCLKSEDFFRNTQQKIAANLTKLESTNTVSYVINGTYTIKELQKTYEINSQILIPFNY